jgi:hypothetical protein
LAQFVPETGLPASLERAVNGLKKEAEKRDFLLGSGHGAATT